MSAEKRTPRQELAERLRGAREYLGLSQDEVAVALQLSRPSVTLMESGGRKIEATELDRLARLYRVSVEYLLSGREPEDTEPKQFAFLARAVKGLSESDVQEVARFAEFLKKSPK
ncbi:helix-turn-helix domain-containing protein [Frateuria defendens]|jgi:transcriptional regulator with XRE-family HTH domain|uniref:helix-turn-helix domain-containing protein n=1 Tax=Frateuria defendens TaxID=2219559 RepID=UPI0009E1E152|nr:helix-turn-helix transcriptional regulator [Frateuria defendens]